MKFKGIFSKSMCCQFFHIFGYIDDTNSIKRAFLDTDSTSDTKYFRDITNFRLRHNFNTNLLGFIDRTVFFTFLFAPFRFAFFRIDDCYSMFVLHLIGYCWIKYLILWTKFNSFINIYNKELFKLILSYFLIL